MQRSEATPTKTTNAFPDPKVPLWQLGDFVFDHQQLLLFHHNNELAAEPKVLELLRYLCCHTDRYVSLSELHERVWSDRIVSDTAVRSSIKKLRNLLDDNDLANPKYIKSVSKRGYKLVCPVQAVVDETAANLAVSQTATPDEVTEPLLSQIHGGNAAMAAALPLPVRRSWWRTYQLWLGSLLLCGMLAWLAWHQQWADMRNTPSSIVLSAFPGEKYSLALSADQRYIAFTGRTSTEQDNQVYLLDQLSGRISQLTQHASNALFVAFSSDSRALLYSNYEPGRSSLHLLQLDDQMQVVQSRTLLEDKAQIAAIYAGASPDQMIVNMADDNGQPAMLYQLELQNGSYQRLLGVSSADEYLYLASYSPDKTRLAIMKTEGNQHWLLVLDSQTRQSLLRLQQELPVDSLSWQDNQQLYLLDADKLQRIEVQTGSRQQVMQNQDGLISAMVTSGEGQLILLQKQQARANRYFSELYWPDGQQQAELISVDKTVGAMLHSAQPKQKWIVQLYDGKQHLALLHNGQRETVPLFSSDDPIELYDTSSSDQVVLSVGQRLAVWSQQEQKLTYLTDPTQLISRASFSADQQHILYGERIAGQWELRAYQLSTGQSRTLKAGYREIQPAEQGYVAANEQGELFLLTPELTMIRPLGQSVSTAAITRWYVRDKKVIWTTFDFRFTYLHSLSLDTGQYVTKIRHFYDFYPRFSASRDGSQLLHMVVQLNPTEIKQLLAQ